MVELIRCLSYFITMLLQGYFMEDEISLTDIHVLASPFDVTERLILEINQRGRAIHCLFTSGGLKGETRAPF